MAKKMKPTKFEGYMADNHGHIHSRFRELQEIANTKGYLRVFIRGKRYLVSRLVCEAWHGPPPTEEHEANHIDYNIWNNKPSNLEWLTPKENREHRLRRYKKIKPKQDDDPF